MIDRIVTLTKSRMQGPFLKPEQQEPRCYIGNHIYSDSKRMRLATTMGIIGPIWLYILIIFSNFENLWQKF